MRRLVACALLLSGHAAAMERSDVHGLDVAILPIPEDVHVDGIALQVRTASGRDVGRLASRVEERWRAEGSEVRRLQLPGWQAISRLDRGWSELVQWTGEGEGARLLHSRLDATRAIASQVPPPFRLPSSCAWGRAVSGDAGAGRYEQRTAVCAGDQQAIQRSVRERLLAQGWSLGRQTGAETEARREGVAARLVVTPGPGSRQGTLVWLAVTPKEHQ